MRRHWRWSSVAVGLFVVLLAGLEARAQVVVDIFGPAIPKFPICVFPFKAQGPEALNRSQEALRILTQDLKISGFFEVLDPSKVLADPFRQGFEPRDVDFEAIRLLGADIVVGGKLETEGGDLRWEARLYDQPQRRMLFGKVYRGSANDLSLMVHKFVDEIIKYYTGEPGIFQTKIAFISSRSGAKELYVMDADGENPKQLTQDKNLVLSPKWSPDGKEIAFISYVGAGSHLFSLELHGMRRKVISARENMNGPAAWSPDGKRICTTLSIQGNPELYLLDTSGNILQRLTQYPGIDVSPTWSPDGRSVAFVSDRAGGPQIFILDVATGQVRRLTFEGRYNSEPAWSPKGDRIAFSAMINGVHKICSIRPDGRELVQLTDGPGNDNSPTWSPDGRYLAFSSTRAGGSQIFIMLFNGQNPVQITRMPGEQSLPSWSPWMTER